jgi:hypothetical protein
LLDATGFADFEQPLLKEGLLDLKVDEQDLAGGGFKAQPGESVGDGDGGVDLHPGFEGFAAAPDDHLGAHVEHALD